MCNVFLLKCLRNNCTLEYSGEEHSIHFLSTMTCAGDEIGWNFVSLVKSSTLSFTAFCDEITRKCKTNNILSPAFLSVKTFVCRLFSWMACMKIDFSKEVDLWCKYQPKVLAGDGTHVGVALQHFNLQHSVTTANIPESKVKPLQQKVL